MLRNIFSSKVKPHLVYILGTRPEIIKFFPYLEGLSKNCDITVVRTNQHYDEILESSLIEELNYKKYSRVMKLNGKWHLKASFKLLLDDIKILRPDAICVLGDTDSARLGAEVAKELKKKLIHIEAGCRSGNLGQIEENNRIAIDKISDIYITPDNEATQNIKNEELLINKKENALFMAEGMGFLPALKINKTLAFVREFIKISKENMNAPQKKIFCTIHRRENLQSPDFLREMLRTLKDLSKDYKVFFLLHPHTEKSLEGFGLSFPSEIMVSEPLDYVKCLAMMKYSDLMITDSGGLQEEGFALGIPTIVARNETEWVRLLRYKGFVLKSFLTDNFINQVEQLIHLDKEDLLEDRKEMIELTKKLDKKIIDFILKSL